MTTQRRRREPVARRCEYAPCGKEYVSTVSRQLYCSIECSRRQQVMVAAGNFKGARLHRPMDAPMTPDEESAVRRAVDAIRAGVTRRELRGRFGERVLRLANEQAGQTERLRTRLPLGLPSP